MEGPPRLLPAVAGERDRARGAMRIHRSVDSTPHDGAARARYAGARDVPRGAMGDRWRLEAATWQGRNHTHRRSLDVVRPPVSRTLVCRLSEQAFKAWTRVFQRRMPGMDSLSQICHNYDRFYRVRYGCTVCRYSLAYANQSYLIEQNGCRRCGGKLRLEGKAHPDGTLVGSDESEALVSFVRKHYATVKVSMAMASNEAVMAELRRQFREQDAQEGRQRRDWAATLVEEAYGSAPGRGSDRTGVSPGVSEADALFAPFDGLRL